MQDRTLQPGKQFVPDEAPPGLQEALSQIGAKSWEKRGSDVMVNTGVRELHFGKELLRQLEIHQGNPEGDAR
jgi:hypothetical protein